MNEQTTQQGSAQNPAAKPPAAKPPESTGTATASGDEVAALPEKPEPRFEIRTPNPSFRGERVGVKFLDGVGRTDDEDAAEACLDFGYTVIVDVNGKKRTFRRQTPAKK